MSELDRPSETPAELATRLIGDRAGAWDVAGRIPDEVIKELGAAGALCAQVPAEYGGLGLSSAQNGELTAHVGALCSSTRSLMTSQGMAAWTIQRLGSPAQRNEYLPRLTAGETAGVAFSEPGAGSDLSAMATTVRPEGDEIVLDGTKVWVTGAGYASMLLVFGRFGAGAAAVVVPADAPGVHVEKVADPLGCRAAGHSTVTLTDVRLPRTALLGAAGQSAALLVSAALVYGRVSVAWGSTGIIRGCLTAAARHAATREQGGRRLAGHQLVAGHLAEMLIAERAATHNCAAASASWDSGSPDLVSAAVLAKHVAAVEAARTSASAVQVLASAGAQDGHVVARGFRDAKVMEIIEGSNEISRLLLADHALAVWA
ncbi:acyl-CoA dehydrogenase family protein [Streptomyces sp. NPDC048331]|uniref:acyl-CoA dehydrogenase family protein n=1 Tax=Streptomyces sp. NPDC048331 TaxID=3365534 RepID=UPI00371DC53A